MREWVNVAELTKPKTLKGGLVARSAPGLPFLLHEGLEVAFVPPQHDAPRHAHVQSVSEQGKGTFLVTFEGVDDITTAELLAGCYVLVHRADIPEEVLLAEEQTLLGFEVHDAAAGFLGTVVALDELPGQSLLRLSAADAAADNAEILIPFVDAFILQIDDEVRRIDVSVPNGLLEL